MQQPDPGPPPSTPPGFGPPPQPYVPAPPGPPPYAPPQAPPAQQPYAPHPAPIPPHPVPAGPEFLAVDRRNAVVVDASGVSFENHGMNLDLTWPEIRSVHYKANGNVLVVGVVHVDGRFYECAVDARRGDRLREWFGQLAGVLGHYRPMG
ncbi:hypothetical protein QQY66_31350 [Streptomyces sp. DG2A-72]|uniref:hypothetical protein n=1 Tax=Streptomyces sp. DG2A-72 TaxID=3051386 RepID=UPI00265BCE3F|nr:hypothetical protein [Streptomyces sp. DG2A-72]MDO0935971.1 hypothetical protein [Streptomyces sp. DG2A-72]